VRTIPKDDGALDALFRAIAGEGSLAAHIANASLPNIADHHDSDAIIARYNQNVDRYVDSVIGAGRRFRTTDVK
jgi:hypothetical protein